MNRIKIIVIFLIFFMAENMFAQMDKMVGIRWYSIVYDKSGNKSEYIETDKVEYSRKIILKAVFEGFAENDIAKFIIVDDEENICFEAIREIKNKEILLECNLLTTVERLSRITEPKVKFKCKINIMNNYFFESCFIDAEFVYIIEVILSNDKMFHVSPHKFILKSDDGIYEKEIDVAADGIFIGWVEYTFSNIIPGKTYSLIYVNGEKKYVRLEKVPFHELLNTIEKVEESRWR